MDPREPLLSSHRVGRGPSRRRRQQQQQRSSSHLGRILPLLALLSLVSLATTLTALPLTRTIELRLCESYYHAAPPADPPAPAAAPAPAPFPATTPPESLCKIPPIQRTLAYVQGLLDALVIGGDLLAAVPAGSFLAARWGPRPVLLLNLVPRLFLAAWAVLVGQVRRLPAPLIVAGAAAAWLGGDCVLNSVVYALVADMADDHVERAAYFGYLSSVTYVTGFAGPAAAAAAMGVRIWLPFALAAGLLAAAVPVVLALAGPHSEPRSATTAPSAAAAPTHRETCPSLPPPPPPSPSPPSPPAPSSSPLHAAGREKESVLATVIRHGRRLRALTTGNAHNFTLLLLTFFLTSLASSDTKLLPQYISNRYGWNLASAGYLLSAKAAVNFVLLTIVFPGLLRARASEDRAQPQPQSPDRSSRHHASLCLGVSVLGALMIGLSQRIWTLVPSLLVYAVGSALPMFTLSLLKSSKVAPQMPAGEAGRRHHHSDVFSVVMLVKAVGSLVGAAVMAASWGWGIHVGGAGRGAPFFVSSACYVIAMAVLLSLSLRG